MRVLLLLASVGASFAWAQEGADACRQAVEMHRSGNVEAAIPAYEKCLPGSGGPPPLRANYGAALAHVGRYQDAIRQYEIVLKSTPGDPRLRYNLILAYYKSGDIRKAADELQSLRRDQPDSAQTALLLADCLLRLGQPKQAVELLEPMEKSQKDDLAFAYVLGVALIQSGNVQRGQAVVDRILRDSNSAEAHLLLGSAAFAQQDFPLAVKEFSSAVAINPGLSAAHSLRGQSLLNTGDADGAAEAFQKALAGDPNDYESNVKLGSILNARKKYAESAPYLQHAVLVRPDSLEAKQELALAYTRMGKVAEAAALGVKPAGAGESETGLLAVGTKAPEFVLPQRAGAKSVRLAELHSNSPLVLVFGSYTCPKLRGDIPALNGLSQQYGDRVKFALVYVQEAHAEGENWQSTINDREKIGLAPAKTLGEKKEYASLCVRKLSIPYPVVVDDLDRKVEQAYAGWPSAVYLIDRNGTIAWRSRLGEQDFSRADLEAAIEKLLPRSPASTSRR